MIPIDLAYACVERMARGLLIMLVIDKGAYPRDFPRGELATETERDGKMARVYWLDPKKVLVWMIKHGMIVARESSDWSGIVICHPSMEKANASDVHNACLN